MLAWTKQTRKDQTGKVICESLLAELPGWGRVSIHTHIHYPGGLFLDCDSLGIEMHPLGQAALDDAIQPAEAKLEQALEQYAAWCREGLEALQKAGKD